MSRAEELNNILYSEQNRVSFVEPVTHGSQRNVITTRMLYFATIDAWKQEGDREFTVDHFDVRFYSKKSGLYRYENGEYKRLFEYVIDARDQIGHRKLVVTIKPRLKSMWYRRNGEFHRWKLPEGRDEATLLYIQSSYMDWDEILELLAKIFKKLDINTAYLAEIREEDSNIITLERHIRVSISVERPVAQTLRSFEFWLRDKPKTKVKAHQDTEEDAYKFYKVTFKDESILPESLKHLDLAFYIKIYRLKDWEAANAPENLKNSFKIEAGVDPKLSGDRIPLALEDELRDFLDALVISILVKTGVQKGNLLEDDHFKPNLRPEKTVRLIDFPTWNEQLGIQIGKIKENEAFGRAIQNDLARAVLKLVTLNGWVDLKKLAQELHYSERRIREVVKMLEEIGLLKRVRTFGASLVQFRNALLEEMVKARIEIAEKELGLGDAIQKVKEKALKRIKKRLTILKKKLQARRVPFRFRVVAEAEVDAEHEDIVPIIELFLEKVREYLNPYLVREWERLLESLKVQRSASTQLG
ncbi:winged helix [Pyrococcus abyssi virus 1]|uniref:transcriptional regulator n=1 Tax=Pyrococcus abyssi virus 1 TaxID=425386 RepID=UPI00015529B1|nr:transcriptional regulator [Pyrococcus abyssi virus 1]ABN58488.1 winged helix [Pyrococcus abyssi virus 1]